jgi:creatinine amidohydrolase
MDQSSGWQLPALTQPQAARALARGTAILVTGSVEQHGGHLPLGTDAYAALTVAERVAARIEAPLLPLSPVGVAPYHLAWPGSLTISPQTLVSLLLDVCDGLARAGVTRVLIVNWHEGNTPALRVGADEVQRRHPLRVIVAETHVITSSLFPDEMEFTHAGSMETAAVLAARPDLVDLAAITPGDDVASGSDGHALFRRRDVFPVMRDFREVAANGWYGSPGRVDQARAEEIFTAVADYVVKEFTAVSAKVTELEQRWQIPQDGSGDVTPVDGRHPQTDLTGTVRPKGRGGASPGGHGA